MVESRDAVAQPDPTTIEWRSRVNVEESRDAVAQPDPTTIEWRSRVNVEESRYAIAQPEQSRGFADKEEAWPRRTSVRASTSTPCL
jgi:hypothetical protein